MKKVLVVVPVEKKHREQILAESEGFEIVFCSKSELTAEQVAEANIIIGNVPPKMICASDNLELLQLESAGADPYIVPGVLAEKTVLCNATGAYGKAVSEHAFALTMMLLKNLHLYRSEQMRANWTDHGMSKTLDGATVLVVGLGDIGLKYASLVKSMGAFVIGVKRRGGNCPENVDELVRTEDIDRVLPYADVIMSVLPGTKDTEYFYSADRFRSMKSSAVFVNCGRGNAVQTEVLLHALQTGEIAAAAVDVTEKEPLPPDSPLWKEEKLVITPHVAGNYHLPDILDRVTDIACENLRRCRNGEEAVNIVDFATGYKR